MSMYYYLMITGIYLDDKKFIEDVDTYFIEQDVPEYESFKRIQYGRSSVFINCLRKGGNYLKDFHIWFKRYCDKRNNDFFMPQLFQMYECDDEWSEVRL